ncbi:MAG: hypothetical protein U0791_25270 [Gemmataceae bacterium]
MASDKEVKFVQVTIRLGATQSYEVLADQRVGVKPTDAEISASSAEGSPDSVVIDVLAKLQKAFKTSQASIAVSVDGGKLVSPGS